MKPENGVDSIDESDEQVFVGDGFFGESMEHFQFLSDFGINEDVATEIIKIYETGKLSHSDLDDDAFQALRQCSPTDAIHVLKGIYESDLEDESNKSAYLCSQLKSCNSNFKGTFAAAQSTGSNSSKIQDILDRTGYSLNVTRGQRKYGGPPPDYDGPPPGPGQEIFCGKIPKHIFEDELIPLFENCGKIWDLRLMMDPSTGLSRGFCFVTFCEKGGAEEAVKQLDLYEISKAKTLKINISVANLRLFIGNIPKNKTKEEIKEEFSRRTEGLSDVIIYSSADDPKLRNRGFAFLEYDTHKNASSAKRRLTSGRVKVWQCDIIVDWADPLEEPDDSTMAKVKVLYIRNLSVDVSEEYLRERFEEFGKIDRVKKIKDYGFVHFEERENCLQALNAMNGEKLYDNEISVTLAKPPSDNRKKEQRRQLGAPDRHMPGGGSVWDDYYARRLSSYPYTHPGIDESMRRLPASREMYYDDYVGLHDGFLGFSSYPRPLPSLVPRHLYHHRQRGRGRGGPFNPPPVLGGIGCHLSTGLSVGLSGRSTGLIPASMASHKNSGRSNRIPSTASMLQRGHTSHLHKALVDQSGAVSKRKPSGDVKQAMSKRRSTYSDIRWGGNQPIAQQPLDMSARTDEGYDECMGNDARWYQDSFEQNLS